MTTDARDEPRPPGTGDRDEVKADGPWRFDEEVTQVFDDMLARSIPQIDVMRQAVTALATRYAQAGSTVIDLGCSKGDAIAQLVEGRSTAASFVGLEVSKPMAVAARRRFDAFLASGTVRVMEWDLRTGLPKLPKPVSVALAVLTLQFVPVEHRQRLVQDVHDELMPGGAFIVVEKVLGSTAVIDDVMVDTYLRHKREAGYSDEEIERKRLALEGVLVPQTALANEHLLWSAGFRQLDCFWRWMNFAGWLAVK
jgi:tRNA (cmo5U34)-methyltransferase